MKKVSLLSAAIAGSFGLAACQDEADVAPAQADITNKGLIEYASASQLKPAVSLPEAVALFTETHPQATIHSVELDSSWGKLQYEISGLDESNEYEMHIDGETKNVIKDLTESERETKNTLDFSAIIDPATAIKTASESPELTEMSPTSWELEADDGIQRYTIQYEQGAQEAEAYVNALSGEMYSIEIDDE